MTTSLIKGDDERMTSPRCLIAGAAVAALILSACSSGPSAPQSANGQSSSLSADSASSKLDVMASFYPLAYLTQEIGGDLVEVSSLTPDGAEPHDLELSPAKVMQIGRADAVVYLAGFQSTVDEAIEHSEPKNVIDVSQAVSLVETSADGNHPAHDHDHEGAEHEATDEHGDHNHADHAHEMTTDPHFWLDPDRMGQAATAIGQALAKADPDNAQTYTANAASIAKKMTALSAELIDGTASCKTTTFVTSHAAFGYLADRTKLTQVGISGLDPESAPSAARLKEISEVVKTEGVTTIFTEALVDPKVAQTLADDLGITTAVLDPIESQSDPAKDYVDVMHDNINALRTALNCQ